MNHYAQDKHQPPEPRQRGYLYDYDDHYSPIGDGIESRPDDPADLDELIAAAKAMIEQIREFTEGGEYAPDDERLRKALTKPTEANYD